MPENTSLSTSAPPTVERLLELVDALEGTPIAVVADLVVDRFISGRPKRVSREAPVLILHQEGDEKRPGGGANAIANVVALGGRALAVGIVGADESGAWLHEHLSSLGLSTDAVAVRDGYRTPTKTRVLGGVPGTVKQQIVRFDVEDELTLSTAEAERIVEAIAAADPRPEVVLLSDYGYGAVTPSLAADLRRRLGPETTLLCDSRFRLGDYRGISGATPNLEEVEAVAQARLDHDPAALGAEGRRLRAASGMDFLLITRGSDGMTLFSDEGTAEIPVHGTDQVADVTGAGDTVIGTLALALAAGAHPLEAALLANYAGGIVVMKAGTATLDGAELRAGIRSDSTPLEGLRWVTS